MKEEENPKSAAQLAALITKAVCIMLILQQLEDATAAPPGHRAALAKFKQDRDAALAATMEDIEATLRGKKQMPEVAYPFKTRMGAKLAVHHENILGYRELLAEQWRKRDRTIPAAWKRLNDLVKRIDDAFPGLKRGSGLLKRHHLGFVRSAIAQTLKDITADRF
jgi:hypothetical protein